MVTVLTRKQKWRRRQMQSPIRQFKMRTGDDLSSENSFESENTEPETECSEKVESPSIQSKVKKVSFSKYLRVKLIPTREELEHLASDLYYTPYDCEKFRREAYIELNIYCRSREGQAKKKKLLEIGVYPKTLNCDDKFIRTSSHRTLDFPCDEDDEDEIEMMFSLDSLISSEMLSSVSNFELLYKPVISIKEASYLLYQPHDIDEFS